MNKKLIALAVASALAAPMTAQAEMSVYGKAHVWFGMWNTKDAAGTQQKQNWQLDSAPGASRLGFKGNVDMENGMKAVYQVEEEVDFTDGGQFSGARNSFLGLKGGFGDLIIGTYDSPLKMAQGDFDQFNDTPGDLKFAGIAAAGSEFGKGQDGENRNKNTVMYMGKSGSLGFNVAVYPGESATGTENVGFMDAYSAAVTFKADALYVAAAMDSHIHTSAQAANSMTRLVGTYDLGAMELGLLYQNGVEKAASSTDANENWLGLSFGMKMGGGKVKAQYIQTGDSATTKTNTTQTSLGYEAKMDKKIGWYVMYTSDTASDASKAASTFTGGGLTASF